MVEKIRYHRQRDEDPMMVFLTNEDAWQGDSLINLYAVWSGVEILVINMATESKIQLWTSKGLMRTLGYEPRHSGRNAEKGASYQPDLALYKMQCPNSGSSQNHPPVKSRGVRPMHNAKKN
jgi:hypothetical protein